MSTHSISTHGAIPLWFKIAYTVMVAVIVPVYWVQHGPANFLWFSDIALLVMLPALWFEHRLLASMMAVGILPMEIAWVADFFTGGHLGIAGYMFDDDMALYLRGLSLFHLVVPPAIILMLLRYGYDRQALPLQTALILVVLPLTWIVTDPADSNINWVHGPGTVQDALPPLIYLGLLMIVVPLCVHFPMHALLKRLFPMRNPS